MIIKLSTRILCLAAGLCLGLLGSQTQAEKSKAKDRASYEQLLEKERSRKLEAPNDFVRVAPRCSVMADGVTQVRAGLENDRNKDGRWARELNVGDYACATMGDKKGIEKHNNKNCKDMSDFCRVCEDNKFYSKLSGHEISSDLYECATGPRTRQAQAR